MILAWKFRELQRLKRDREAREAEEAEQAERDRRRAMTEEQRLEDLRLNPRILTNKSEKGKMKFLQKYYHKGAFYMDQENELYKVQYEIQLWPDNCPLKITIVSESRQLSGRNCT